MARAGGALYHVAAALDLLKALGAEREQRVGERDSLLQQLGVERLPALELGPAHELAAAIGD
jgi:hypothetical protein